MTSRFTGGDKMIGSKKQVNDMFMNSELMSKGGHTMAWLLVLIILLLPSLCEAEQQLYTRNDQLACEETKIQSSTTCSEDSYPRSNIRKCKDQHFVFFNGKTGKLVRVKSNAEYTSSKNEKMNAKWITAFAWSWACVRGKGNSYVIILYTTGGNCSGCEWAEIYDLDGNMIVSNKGYPIEEKNNEFKGIYEKLELPNQWPRSSFSNIQYLKEDFK